MVSSVITALRAADEDLVTNEGEEQRAALGSKIVRSLTRYLEKTDN